MIARPHQGAKSRTAVVRAMLADGTRALSRSLIRAFLPTAGLALAHLTGCGSPFTPRSVPSRAAPTPQPSAAPKLNPPNPPGPAPEGMVWVPGGTFWMGCDHEEMSDARPWHLVSVDGFWMDRTEVTNEAFARFVRATGYVTIAERRPDPKDFPEAPLESLVPGAVVFTPPRHAVRLDDHYQWWSYVKGASWRHPEGPASDLRGRDQHPVVEVAWPDAVAYANWAGKRLPTEAEWELAARGGQDRKVYGWGDEMKPGGRWMANIWQGRFPDENRAEDGYRGTAPVASFPAEGYGLYDMAGNVWEWCSDWYRPDYYRTLAAGGIARNPTGPPDTFDPQEPGVKKRVNRGGSFLCSDQYCSRYVLGSRGKGEPDTGTSNLGFRCVRGPTP